MWASQTNIAPTYDAIVSGAGPSGLATAYEFAKRGYQTLIVDIHADSIRPQLVFLVENTSVDYLKQVAAESPLDSKEDKEFTDKLNKSREHYNIKDIEKFFKRRLVTKNNCHFKQGSISEINMHAGKVTIQSEAEPPQSVQFTYLVGADGVKHPTAEVLKKTNNSDMAHYRIPSHKNLNHITTYVTLKSRANEEIELAKGQTYPLYTLKYSGQNAYFYLEDSSYEKSRRRKIKANITTTLPQRIYDKWKKALKDEKDPEFAQEVKREIEQEIKTIVQVLYPQCDVEFIKSHKHPQTKDPLKIQLFKTELSEATHAAIVVNGHIYALVGDALRTPDFYQGHGIELGLLEARRLVELLSTATNSTAVQLYHEFYRENTEEIKKGTEKIKKAGIIVDTVALSTNNEFRIASEIDDIIYLISQNQKIIQYLNNKELQQAQPQNPDFDVIGDIYQMAQTFRSDLTKKPEDWQQQKAKILVLLENVTQQSAAPHELFNQLNRLLLGTPLKYFKDSTLAICHKYLSRHAMHENISAIEAHWQQRAKILIYDLNNALTPVEILQLISADILINWHKIPVNHDIGSLHINLEIHFYHLLNDCYFNSVVDVAPEQKTKETFFQAAQSPMVELNVFTEKNKNVQEEKIDTSTLEYFVDSSIQICTLYLAEQEKNRREGQSFTLLNKEQQNLAKILIYDVKNAEGRRDVMDLIDKYLQNNISISGDKDLGGLHEPLQKHLDHLSDCYRRAQPGGRKKNQAQT